MLALSGSQMEKTNTVRNINICQEFISEHIFSNAGTLRLSDENIWYLIIWLPNYMMMCLVGDFEKVWCKTGRSRKLDTKVRFMSLFKFFSDFVNRLV